jgi:signal transduction histidine kinase
MSRGSTLRIIAICLIVSIVPAGARAAERTPRSVLIISQWDPDLPWYAALASAFHSTLLAGSTKPVAIYAEALDLSRFHGPTHHEVFRSYLRDKYRDKPVDVVVPVGSLALEYVLNVRSDLWPNAPVVFSTVDETTAAGLKLPADVTGNTLHMTIRNLVSMAQALVPDLRRVALVGEVPNQWSIYRNFRRELPAIAAELEVIDLTGLPMSELTKRVAELPENTAILYTAIFVDGAGIAFNPPDALAALAAAANRPIVVGTETQLGNGAVGGFIFRPGLVGAAAARLVSRILNGERAADIPVALGDFARPIFDWRQLKRWGINRSRLPPDSEIRFAAPSIWDEYRSLIIVVGAAFLLQTGLIAALVTERRRRASAQVETRSQFAQIRHMSRNAGLGALSSSITHELNQPLGAILSNSEAAGMLLQKESPDLDLLRKIVADIRRSDLRASEIIAHLRNLLNKNDVEAQALDVNDAIGRATELLGPEAKMQGVLLNVDLDRRALPVRANAVQLEQVIVIVALNGMEAMSGVEPCRRQLTIRSSRGRDGTAEIAVSDCGAGIPDDRLEKIFDAFYTTKEIGMGLGLSIARSIVEHIGGRIWAENRRDAGAVFRIGLPLAEAPVA